jgi:hypothetical protein
MHYVEAFLASMRMDLTVTQYETYDDLMTYVHGSAAVIGLEMVPVLEPVVPREVADPYAADLGIAFQLSNFIRDVGEDLRRGRVYLPMEDLRAFGVTREHLEHGVVDGPVPPAAGVRGRPHARALPQRRGGVRLLHPTEPARASRRRSRCTAASSTRSSGPTTTCCASGSASAAAAGGRGAARPARAVAARRGA